MNLWKVEVARLIRTNRWMIVLGVYAFFGILGPITARYLGEILARFGGDLQVVVPDPEPIDGIGQFVSNASQLGVLAVVVVAAGSLAVDARPELAAFYRTRVSGGWALLRPRVWVVTAASVLSLAVGTGFAVAGTESLIGRLDLVGVTVGTVLSAGYLAFIVALTAAMATVTRSPVTTVFAVLAVALLLPLFGLAAAVRPWLPSELLAAPLATAEGAGAGDFVRSLLAAAAATGLLLVAAARRLDTREI